MSKPLTFEVVGNQKIACEGCEQRIEGLLKRLAGVRMVRARAGNQRVEVLLDPAKLGAGAEGTLLQKLRDAGYEARLIEGGSH